MSIFHCLDFDSKTYTVYLVADNPETNYRIQNIIIDLSILLIASLNAQ